MRLTTEQAVKALKSPDTGVKVYTDDQITGFGVRCSQGGSKSYVLTLPGADRSRVTIGKVGVVGLADARVVAKRMLAEEALGRHRPKRQTFTEALAAFLDTRKQRNRPKTAYETERLLRFYFKPLHSMNLDDIRAHHITDITDALSKKGLQSTASHAHTAAHTFLRFCSQRHYILFNPIADLEKPRLPKPRERVLSDDELRTVWQAAGELGGHFGDIVRLLLLTGQRRSEIGSLRADYINDNQICLPSTLTKNRRTHTFPIGALAAAILSSNITKQTTSIFPARGQTEKPFNGWSKAKAQLDEKIGEIYRQATQPIGIEQNTFKPFTLHDLRRTYATNLQRLGIKLEVIEALLNHISGTRAGIVGTYQRHRYEEEMREGVQTFDTWFSETILEREEL